MTSYLTWADRRLLRLQDGYIHGTYTRGDMSHLRQSLRRPCGSDPRASKWSLDGMPGYRGGAYPSWMEKASWYAFALYAIHQQGEQEQPMYRSGIFFNEALHRLVEKEPDAVKIVARLASARDLDEALVSLTRLVRLLREHRIPCDHARLALDLRTFQNPRSRDRVRAGWSRNLCPLPDQPTHVLY